MAQIHEMNSSNLPGALPEWRRKAGSMLMLDPPIELLPDGAPGPRRFKITATDPQSRRSVLSSLLKGRLGWRSTPGSGLPAQQATQGFTLAATLHSHTIGSLTVGFDGVAKLSADGAFANEVQALRNQGQRLCEFSQLAIDPTVGTKRVLAALFHVGYIVAHRLRGYDTLLIEVNPRHMRYYERMLGCRVLGQARINRRADVPAVLLSVEFAYIMTQIGEFGGRPETAATEQSLYPFAFSLSEEAGIISHMKSRYEHWRQEHTPQSESQFLPSDLIGL